MLPLSRRLSTRLTLTTFLALSAGAGLTAGCGAQRVAAPDDALTDASALYARMMTRVDEVQTSRIKATLEYYGEEGRVRIRQLVLAAHPASLRVETLSPFNSTLSVLTTNGESLSYFDLQAEQFYAGAADAQNVGRLISIAMTPADLVRVVLGGPPLDTIAVGPDEWTMEWDRRYGAYAVDMPTRDEGEGAGTLRLYVQHGTWAVTGAHAEDAGGAVRFDVRLGNFTEVTDGTVTTEVPSRIQFRMPDGEREVDVSLDVDEYQLNPELPAVLFELQAPPGLVVQPL